MKESKPKSIIMRNMNSNPLKIEDKISIISELLRFATYKNLSFIERADTHSESDTEDETEDKCGDETLEIEFIGKRASQNVTKARKDKTQKKKLKVAKTKVTKKKNDKMEDAIKDMAHIYKLFDALDGLSPSDIDTYLDDTCKFKRFTGVLVLRKIISSQCLLFEVIGLIRKKYHLVIEK